MNKRTIPCGISIVALFLVIAVIPVLAQPTADSFGVNDASGDPETYVIVPVNITNATNRPIQAIVFNIAYDKSVINITSVLRADLTSNWNLFDFNNNFEGGTRVSPLHHQMEIVEGAELRTQMETATAI